MLSFHVSGSPHFVFLNPLSLAADDCGSVLAGKGPPRRFAPWTAAGRSGRRGCLRGKGDGWAWLSGFSGPCLPGRRKPFGHTSRLSRSGGSGASLRLPVCPDLVLDAFAGWISSDVQDDALASLVDECKLHKRTVSQPFGPGRIFKDLGVAKRYCRINVISDRFLQRRPETVPLPPAYGQLHREARPTRLEDRTLGRWGASSIN